MRYDDVKGQGSQVAECHMTLVIVWSQANLVNTEPSSHGVTHVDTVLGRRSARINEQHCV